MAQTEFIIVLTEHRFLGNIFQACMIERKEKFFSVLNVVKPADFDNDEYEFQAYEKELILLIDRYSDKKLMRRFSRAKNVVEFYEQLDNEKLNKFVLPYIEQCKFKIASILMLSPVRLMKKEINYPNLYEDDIIEVPPFFAKPVLYFERTSEETLYRLKVFLEKKEIFLQNQNVQVITDNPCVITAGRQLLVFEKMDSKKLRPFLSKEYISVPKSMEEKYFAGFVRNSVRNFDVVAKGFQLIEAETEKFAILSLEYDLESKPTFVLKFRYDDEKFYLNSTKNADVKFQNKNDEFIIRKISRDFEWENSVLNVLSEFRLTEKNGYYYLSDLELLQSDDLLYYFIAWISENRKVLEQKRILIEQDKLGKIYFTGERKFEAKTDLSEDWFDVNVSVTFGSFTFPFSKLKKYILNDIREFELPDGKVAVIPKEWFSRYKTLFPFARIKGDKMMFERHYFALLQNILMPFDDSIMGKVQKSRPVSGKNILPDGLKAEMRSYQKTGFDWLTELHKNGFGGCLADDMGLGKTLQTLALLLKFKRKNKNPFISDNNRKSGQLELFAAEESNGNKQLASLVVVPVSLIHNWESEIMKFTPSLKVYKHVGQQRKTDTGLENALSFYDIVLTTYGIVRNETDILSRFKFFYLILDESQYVKNPSSKIYKAVMKLRSEHRLVLTGTPIENSLLDLWAQMNFLNRGILGNLAFFRRFFITPVEKHNSREQQDKLQILIRPFILRRTKDEVAQELPKLMEQIVICEMDETQKLNYEIEKSAVRNSILSGAEKDGVENSAIIILRGLTRLRQLANHPKLLEDYGKGESGKFSEIFRMLENIVAENHKVLVFSSFVKHLELIRAGIEKEKWKYSMLTGQTSNRKEVIRQFQEDSENRIFLISLKAGGVGLNLTGAGYVFIIDPWWNPAVENQAISRAHRIGQNKPVFVYRFITEDSIEQKIQHLKEKKSLLADKFINTNNPLQEISKEELLSLLK